MPELVRLIFVEERECVQEPRAAKLELRHGCRLPILTPHNVALDAHGYGFSVNLWTPKPSTWIAYRGHQASPRR